MSNYSKTTNFTAKDALSSGDPNKVIKGSEHDAEYDNIATASATKPDKATPATTNNLAMLDASGNLADSLVESDGSGNITTNVTVNLTGNVTGNADTVTTNANLTGTHVTSSGNATTLVAGSITTTEMGTDSVGSDEIAAGAVGTSEIASGGVRFNDEIALGTASGNWSVNNTTGQVIPRGVYNMTVASATGVYVQVYVNGSWRTMNTMANDTSYQAVSDGTNVRLLSSSGSVTTYYDEIFD